MLPAFIIPLLINMGVGASLSALMTAASGGASPQEIEAHKAKMVNDLIAAGMSPQAAQSAAEEAATPGGATAGDIGEAAIGGAVGGALGYGAFKAAGGMAGKIGSFLGKGATAATPEVEGVVSQSIKGMGKRGPIRPSAPSGPPRLGYEQPSPRVGYESKEFTIPPGQAGPISGRVGRGARFGDPIKTFDATPAPEAPARYTDLGPSVARGGERLGYTKPLERGSNDLYEGSRPGLAEEMSGITQGYTPAQSPVGSMQAQVAKEKLRQMSAMQELRRRQAPITETPITKEIGEPLVDSDADFIADAILAGKI